MVIFLPFDSFGYILICLFSLEDFVFSELSFIIVNIAHSTLPPKPLLLFPAIPEGMHSFKNEVELNSSESSRQIK